MKSKSFVRARSAGSPEISTTICAKKERPGSRSLARMGIGFRFPQCDHFSGSIYRRSYLPILLDPEAMPLLPATRTRTNRRCRLALRAGRLAGLAAALRAGTPAFAGRALKASSASCRIRAGSFPSGADAARHDSLANPARPEGRHELLSRSICPESEPAEAALSSASAAFCWVISSIWATAWLISSMPLACSLAALEIS